jgi:hypothetical protein
MHFLLSMFLERFIGILFFLPGIFIAQALWWWMPDSKLKRLLFKRLR